MSTTTVPSLLFRTKAKSSLLSRKQKFSGLADTKWRLCFGSILSLSTCCFSATRLVICTIGLQLFLIIFFRDWRWFSRGKQEMSFNEQPKNPTSSATCLNECTVHCTQGIHHCIALHCWSQSAAWAPWHREDRPNSLHYLTPGEGRWQQRESKNAHNKPLQLHPREQLAQYKKELP